MIETVRSHPTHLLVCALCLALGPWSTLATPAAAQTVDVFVTVPDDSGPTDPGAPRPPAAPTTPPGPETPDVPSASPVEPLPRTGGSVRDLAAIAAALVALGTTVLKSTNSRKRASHA